MTEPVYSNPSPDHQITKLHLHELFKPSAPCIISSSSSDCESQRTRSTATLPISFGSSIKMNSFDSTETDDEIVNIMQTDTSRAGHGNAAVISPFERWTTPRIANRKILTPEDANTSAVGMIDFESASVAPSSIAPPSTASVFQDFSFACEDLSMTQFEKADSEFFAPFNSGNKNKVVQSSEGSNIPLREQVTVKQEALNEEVMKEEVVKQEPVLSKAPSEENSLNPDDCRPLNVKDINDIVNASKHQTGTVHRYHRDNDNPSLHDSSYMDECSTAAKSLNSSPQSVMDFDNSTFASSKMSKPRRKKKNQGRNLNTSSFSEAGESRTTRDTFDDDTSSFVSSKVSYSLRDDTRIRVGRISDDSSSKQSSVVENIVYSAPLARLHEFITGNGLCCTSKGQDSLIIGEACSEYERKSPKKSSYDDNEYYDDNTTFYDEDDVTYDDTTYTGMDDETASYRHRRGGSAYSIESSAYYTTDDDETVSRASTRSSYHHHVTKSSSHKSTPEPLKLKASPLGSRGSSRGRSPTIRNGYNSDRSLSRCASTASSGNSNEKLVQGTKLKECDSRDISLKSNESSQASAEASAAAESVLLQDQNSWMEMTSPSPYRSVNISTDSAQTSSSKKSLNASMGSTKSNFLQNLQAKTASAKITPTKAQCASTTIESFNAHKTSPETDGTFKVCLYLLILHTLKDSELMLRFFFHKPIIRNFFLSAFSFK